MNSRILLAVYLLVSSIIIDTEKSAVVHIHNYIFMIDLLIQIIMYDIYIHQFRIRYINNIQFILIKRNRYLKNTYYKWLFVVKCYKVGHINQNNQNNQIFLLLHFQWRKRLFSSAFILPTTVQPTHQKYCR